MSQTPRLVALMPMRHTSERVPGKNFRPFGDGRPLFHHMVDVLQRCEMIDRIVIDTDSPTISAQCAELFPTVCLIDRPEHLRDGSVPMNDVLLHDSTQVQAEFYVQTHSTNPLLRAETVQRAVTTFFENYPTFDSLFTVTRLQTRLWDQLARPINHNANILLRTQDLPPVFEENSCLYLFPREELHKRGRRIGDRPYMFETDPLESLDIDEEVDFTIAETVFRTQSPGSN